MIISIFLAYFKLFLKNIDKNEKSILVIELKVMVLRSLILGKKLNF